VLPVRATSRFDDEDNDYQHKTKCHDLKFLIPRDMTEVLDLFGFTKPTRAHNSEKFLTVGFI
jgi:hypothetical protein